MGSSILNRWRVRRPDGRFFSGYSGGGTDVPCFTERAEDGAAFLTETGAQHLIDIARGSMAGRRFFDGCRAVLVPRVESGEFIVCACGLLHEAEYCPTAAGHGALL